MTQLPTQVSYQLESSKHPTSRAPPRARKQASHSTARRRCRRSSRGEVAVTVRGSATGFSRARRTNRTAVAEQTVAARHDFWSRAESQPARAPTPERLTRRASPRRRAALTPQVRASRLCAAPPRAGWSTTAAASASSVARTRCAASRLRHRLSGSGGLETSDSLILGSSEAIATATWGRVVERSRWVGREMPCADLRVSKLVPMAVLGVQSFPP